MSNVECRMKNVESNSNDQMIKGSKTFYASTGRAMLRTAEKLAGVFGVLLRIFDPGVHNGVEIFLDAAVEIRAARPPVSSTMMALSFSMPMRGTKS